MEGTHGSWTEITQSAYASMGIEKKVGDVAKLKPLLRQ